MYKQKCKGSDRRLLPVLFLTAFGLILWSATDATTRAFAWPYWVYVPSILLLLAVIAVTWRFTDVQMEYMWFGKEFVVRRVSRIHAYRISIPVSMMTGYHGLGHRVGRRLWGGHGRNCCATVGGCLLHSSTLCYYDEYGLAWKIRLEVCPEIAAVLAEAVENQMIEQETGDINVSGE